MRAKLLEAQIRVSRELMQQQIGAMSEVRNSWVEAKRMLQPAAPVSSAGVLPASSVEGGAVSEWHA